MKKRVALLATALLSVSLLTGCGEVAKVSLAANWYGDTSITNAINGTEETLVYDVTYQSAGSTNKYYSVKYDIGRYVTKLTNDIYTWDDGSKEEVYKLESSLTISGAYTMNETSVAFDDLITSVTYFRPVTANLTPIYSEKHVRSTSPTALVPEDAEHMCVTYDYTNYIVYEKDLSKATVTTKWTNSDTPTVKEYALGVSGSIFDNEVLLFAGRGMNFTSSSSSNATAYTASVLGVEVGKVQTVKYAYSSAQNTRFMLNGSELEIPTKTVTLSLGGNYAGAAQTLVYADKVTTGVNTYRNVLISMKTSLSYSLGSLTYTLIEASFTNK